MAEKENKVEGQDPIQEGVGEVNETVSIEEPQEEVVEQEMVKLFGTDSSQNIWNLIVRTEPQFANDIYKDMKPMEIINRFKRKRKNNIPSHLNRLFIKIEELDKRKAVINNTVDLAPMEEKIATLKVDLIDRIDAVEEQIKPTDLTKVFAEIGKIKEQIASLPKPINTKPIYDSLTKLEEYGWELEEDIEELSKDVAVVKKENELQDVLIEEVKALNSNPLGG